MNEFFNEYHRDELKRLRENFYKKHENFVRDYRYLAANIPLHELDVVRSKEPFEKEVREYDLAKEEFTQSTICANILAGYLDNIEKAMNNGLSFLFYGTNETGKTIEAIRCLFVALSRGYSGYYIDFRDLMRVNNEAMYGDNEVDSKLMHSLLSCDFLVVDEIGKESSVTENVIGSLERIIKKRTSSQLSTILVTNIYVPGSDEMQGFKERYGNSVFNALIRNYKALEFSSKGEFRKKSKIDWDEIL